MPFDFTTMLDRTNRDAIAVESIPIPGAKILPGYSRLPMWIADMNFIGAPSITAALADRITTPAYGYFDPRREYYDSILNWHRTRNGITSITEDDIGYQNGVLGGMISAVRALVSPGGKVLLHTPTYIGFTGALERNGYKIVHSPLKRDARGIWRMDFEDMDRKLKEEKIHLTVFCSPHNPAGRVWERWELEQAMEVFDRNDCYVICDEIWSDLIVGEKKHIPFFSINDTARRRTVTLYAPSKTFNLAGLIGSYHVIPDPWLKDRVMAESSLSGYNSMNVLSMYALIGAYSQEGAQWLDELLTVLRTNIDLACDVIERKFEGVTLMKPEGTYMLYLDCSGWLEAHQKTIQELALAGASYGVIWANGTAFNVPNTIRMNLALPTAYVQEAFDRLDRLVFNA